MKSVFVAGVVTVAISVLSLYGWGSATIFLQSKMLNAPDMTPITAMVLLGFGVVLMIAGSVSPGRLQGFSRMVCLIVLVLAVVTGTWTIAEYFLDGLPSIDLIFFRDTVLQNGGQIPGRSSPHSAVCFVLFGKALLLMISTRRPARWAAAMVTAILSVALGFNLLVILGYLTNTRGIFVLPNYPMTGMSLMTAVGFILIGYGLVQLQRSSRTLKDELSQPVLPVPEN